jgi:hypothetical protein
VEMGISIPMSSEELATSILGVGSRLPWRWNKQALPKRWYTYQCTWRHA